MTSTVTVRSTASVGLPSASQVTKVMSPAMLAKWNSSADARSANACARDRDAWACLTRRRMPASAVASPTASTRTRSAESVATVPATTRSPGVLGTGRDSPVIIGLVDLGLAVGPDPVGRDPGARAHEHDVTGGELIEADGLDLPSGRTRSAWSGSRAVSASRRWRPGRE